MTRMLAVVGILLELADGTGGLSQRGVDSKTKRTTSSYYRLDKYGNSVVYSSRKEDSADRCYNFSTLTVAADGFSEGVFGFSSPGYPLAYSSNLECVRLIEAPVQHFVILDFRDSFSVENASRFGCEYDYVEVRDGPFGFSPLIGKFCGHTNPKPIVSRTRYVWMRFVSDQAIEYQGFRVAFRFANYLAQAAQDSSWIKQVQTEPMAELCYNQVQVADLSEGTLTSLMPVYLVANAALYTLPIDCVFELRVSDVRGRFFLRLENLVVPIDANCDLRFIEVYDRSSSSSQRRRVQCTSDTTASYQSVSNRILLRVYAHSVEYLPRFFATYTVFHEAPCDANQYDCGDRTCINSTFVCNGRMNCDHHSDELRCNSVLAPDAVEKPFESISARRSRELKLHLLVVTLISLSLSLIALACAVFKYKRHRKRVFEYRAVLTRRASSENANAANDQNRSCSPSVTWNCASESQTPSIGIGMANALLTCTATAADGEFLHCNRLSASSHSLQDLCRHANAARPCVERFWSVPPDADESEFVQMQRVSRVGKYLARPLLSSLTVSNAYENHERCSPSPQNLNFSWKRTPGRSCPVPPPPPPPPPLSVAVQNTRSISLSSLLKEQRRRASRLDSQSAFTEADTTYDDDVFSRSAFANDLNGFTSIY